MFVSGLVLGHSLFAPNGVETAIGDINGTSVTGIGGVFFKASDPAKLRDWYREHLGVDAGPQGFNFFWREPNAALFGRTVWSIFPEGTQYFGDEGQDLMINYRVSDLDALLTKLQRQGVIQVGEVEEYWYGRFAWIIDGEGNRVELWEPVYHSPEEYKRKLKSQAASR